MGEAMIVRRGGFGSGGGGFDPNGAVLKVVTSTGCSVTVTGTGYSKTQQTGEGFIRSADAEVTEHLFSIPASAFGPFTVTVSKVYSSDTLTASKSITVNSAGKVYEVLIGAPNIILNSIFGLQGGYSIVASGASYNESTKLILANGAVSPLIRNIPIKQFTKLKCTARFFYNQQGYSGSISLRPSDNSYIYQCYLSPFNNNFDYTTIEGDITNKTTDVSVFHSAYISYIKEIILT